MKTVKDCKDVSIMSPQDEQWKRTSLLCLHTALLYYKFLVLLSTTVCSQNINKMWTQQTKLLQITAFSPGITILNQRIILKDDIKFVPEYSHVYCTPCIVRLLDLRIWLFMCLLHTVLFLIRVYKHSTVVSLHCLFCRNVKKHH